MPQTSAKTLWVVGWTLFVVSFFLPSGFLREPYADHLRWGYEAFIVVAQTLEMSYSRANTPVEWKEQALLVCLWSGWLANFTVFPLPWRLLAWPAITAPWILMMGFVLFGGSEIDFSMLRFVPFYPWAVGIGVINLANLKRLGQREVATEEGG